MKQSTINLNVIDLIKDAQNLGERTVLLAKKIAGSNYFKNRSTLDYYSIPEGPSKIFSNELEEVISLDWQDELLSELLFAREEYFENHSIKAAFERYLESIKAKKHTILRGVMRKVSGLKRSLLIPLRAISFMPFDFRTNFRKIVAGRLRNHNNSSEDDIILSTTM
ncbi:MAG: hypothetical protein KDC58_09650 [Cyclobacteriaceae bacterium]|nr:hypothetical protein [Cyclobacteriaceae bacterium]